MSRKWEYVVDGIGVILLFLALMYFFSIRLSAEKGERVSQRNLAWNTYVSDDKVQVELLLKVQAFLKSYENQHYTPLDVGIVQCLDSAIMLEERKLLNLRKLRRELLAPKENP